MVVTKKRTFGNQGESAAVDWLTNFGWAIVARNFSCTYGEIDIIAIDKNVLVFIEVKTRQSLTYGPGYMSVTTSKVRKIARAGEYFQQKHPELPQAARIDVLSVFQKSNGFWHIEHMKAVNAV